MSNMGFKEYPEHGCKNNSDYANKRNLYEAEVTDEAVLYQLLPYLKTLPTNCYVLTKIN
ncbi:hypothetical protein [Psychrobacillus psychrotolerans]|uniref:hypothetical protein n=1 Tax=Psychrobacillus psychrotolerans TaxID=126156 RepID=UPI0015871822|nr:hypothetical protein [Psychrobacillus psychrotolerans]